MLAIVQPTLIGTRGQNDQIAQSVLSGAMTLPALLVVSASAARNKGIEVNFKTSDGQDAGTATLTPDGKGVKVKLNLMNLPEGEHALHVHQNAKCDGPDFKTAGPRLQSRKQRARNQESQGSACRRHAR